MAKKPSPKVERVTSLDKAMFSDGSTKDVALNPLLHKLLKIKAATEGTEIKTLVEVACWPLVGGKPEAAK